MDTIAKEVTLSKYFSFLCLWVSALKEKNLLLWSKLLPFRVDLFSKETKFVEAEMEL